MTALYDIGRGEWPSFSRSFNQYLRRLHHLLQLEVDIVVFGDRSLKAFVREHRQTSRARTTFVTKPFSKLDAFRHRPYIEDIMASAEFRQDNELLAHPEAFSADYVILVNSKAALLAQVVRTNPFNSSHVFWIDAGYVATEDDEGAWQVHVPPRTAWRPRPLLELAGRITYIALHNPSIYVNVTDLHKLSAEPAFAGGFFGGDVGAVAYYDRLFRKSFLRQLADGIADDDQGTAFAAYCEQPGIFNLVPGSWFDAYRLFH